MGGTPSACRVFACPSTGQSKRRKPITLATKKGKAMQNMDNDFSRDILISAMQSILENPSFANMQEQLERLTDIEKLHLKKLIDMQVTSKAKALDELLKGNGNG